MASCEIETRVLARAPDIVARRAVFVTLAGRIAPAGAAIVFVGRGCIYGTLGGGEGEEDEKGRMVGDHGVATAAATLLSPPPSAVTSNLLLMSSLWRSAVQTANLPAVEVEVGEKGWMSFELLHRTN